MPGSVIGAVLLFIALWLVPGLHAKIAPFSHTLLRNMLVLFVPASVGMMAIFGDIAEPRDRAAGGVGDGDLGDGSRLGLDL